MHSRLWNRINRWWQRTMIFLLALVVLSSAADPTKLKPLEWQLSFGSNALNVSATLNNPGSRELSAAAQSGDAIFVFGGQSHRGLSNSLYVWGTDTKGELGWTFFAGDHEANSHGRFGQLKSLSAHNYPSARAGACMDFITSSHALLFGGRGLDSKGKRGFLNDLWLSEDMAQWGWMEGSDTVGAPSVYTGKSVTPGARWKHSCASNFEHKKFLVFGGQGEHPDDPNGTAILDDLFQYGENGWEYLAGGGHSQPPDFDNKNLSLRHPGGRSDHGSVMVESGMYVFGGMSLQRVPGQAKLKEVMMADLWVWDMLNHTWVYVSGSHIPNAPGVYPSAFGVGGANFGPGARVQAAIAFNDLTNDIYIFGGFGVDYNSNVGLLNDLWYFSVFYKVWTWLGGSSSASTPGDFSLTPFTLPSGRAGALLFSGTDGFEGDLTLLGGVSAADPELDEEQAELGGLSDVWMVNVRVPPNFTSPAPPSTTTHRTVAPPSTQKPTTHADEHTTEPHKITESVHATEDSHKTSSKTTSKAVPQETLAPTTSKSRPPATHESLFQGGSPQKIAALVMGSFVAVVILVGGIVFLGFAFVSNAATAGSRTVVEPYLAV